MELKDYRSGTVLFAVPFDDEALNDAKEYCETNELTTDDVIIVKKTYEDEENIQMLLVKVR